MPDIHATLVGQKVPAFSMRDDEGNIVENTAVLGRWTVLFFYPKDHSLGCTLESCAFRDSHDRFERAGTTIYGISTDDTRSHAAFRKKHRLPFNLLTDERESLAQALGLKKTLGLLRARVTLVLDPNGVIQFTHTSQFGIIGHVSKAIEAIHRQQARSGMAPKQTGHSPSASSH